MKKSKGLSFEKRILIFFFLVIAIIAVIVYIFIKLSGESKQNRDLLSRTETALSLTDSMLSNEQAIVIATRSYIITADETYLENVATKLDSFKTNLLQLRLLIANDAAQKKVDSISQVYAQYQVIREKTITLRRQQNFQINELAAYTIQADKILARLNSLFASLKADEVQLLAEKKLLYQEKIRHSAMIVRILLLVFIISILLAFVIVYRNSVRRKKAELALRKSEELVRSIINYAPILVNIKDTDGKYILVNQHLADVLKTQPEQMIGKTNHAFYSVHNSQLITTEDQEVVNSLQPTELEIKIQEADGVHTYITSKFPLFDGHGKLYAVGSTSFDITPIKAAHEALEKSYRQQQKILNGLQQTLSASSDLMCIVNDEGNFVMISDTCTSLLGYTPKEMMNKNFRDFILEEDIASTELIAEQIIAGEPITDFTNRYRKKDGTVVPILWSAKWSTEDKMMYCIGRNATEKVQAAYQLAQSQSRLSHAQTIARLGNWDWDLKNNVWSCSDEVYHLLGLEKETAKNIQQLLIERCHPDDRNEIERLRDEALLHGRNIDIEHRIIRPDSQVRYMHTKGEVRIDNHGQPTWFSGTIQDITQHKEVELKLQQLNTDLQLKATELRSTNAELERFAYVASHDLQEPLRMVTSFLSLLQKKHVGDFDETSNKYIHFAVDGAERMKGLIQDLLLYSRLGSSTEKFTTFPLKEVIDQVLLIYDLPIKENNALVTVDNMPVVTGNKIQLTQLFQNLVGNALKYRSEESPRIFIDCKEENNHWLLSVKDNGIGIDPRYFEKIFVIFQRLHNKTEYSGTGIGLAISKKIIESHGGKIWVDSNPDKGSIFYFTLKKTHND